MLILKDKMRPMMKILLYVLSFFSSIGFADTLFICSGDVNRCYIAQEVARELLYHPGQARSLSKDMTPDKKAIDVLNAWNIQESSFIKPLDAKALAKADLILTMTQNEKEQLIHLNPQFSKKISTMSQCATGKNVDISSLKGKDLKNYEQIRNLIFQYEDMISVRGWVCDALHH